MTTSSTSPFLRKDREHRSFVDCPDGAVARQTSQCDSNLTGRTFNIINKSLAVADTEVSQSLTSGTNKIIVKTRNLAELKISFTSSESGTKFITLPVGCVLELDSLTLTSETIYMQSTSAGVTVEILEIS